MKEELKKAAEQMEKSERGSPQCEEQEKEENCRGRRKEMKENSDGEGQR